MNSKLRIRIGEIEIDCEATEHFLKHELPQLLQRTIELHRVSGVAVSSTSPSYSRTVIAQPASGIRHRANDQEYRGEAECKIGV